MCVWVIAHSKEKRCNQNLNFVARPRLGQTPTTITAHRPDSHSTYVKGDERNHSLPWRLWARDASGKASPLFGRLGGLYGMPTHCPCKVLIQHPYTIHTTSLHHPHSP